MNYINFVILTDTPARLRNFLVNRGVIEQTTDMQGNVTYKGTRPGMEWVEVPNPIMTDPGSGVPPIMGEPPDPSYVPPTYDTRKVYLVKFAHESAENEVDGPLTEPGVDDQGNPIQVPVNQYDWSKFGRWVKNNSTVVNAPANYTINGEHAGAAYRINGENVWLVRDEPERFGVWQ